MNIIIPIPIRVSFYKGNAKYFEPNRLGLKWILFFFLKKKDREIEFYFSRFKLIFLKILYPLSLSLSLFGTREKSQVFRIAVLFERDNITSPGTHSEIGGAAGLGIGNCSNKTRSNSEIISICFVYAVACTYYARKHEYYYTCTSGDL